RCRARLTRGLLKISCITLKDAGDFCHETVGRSHILEALPRCGRDNINVCGQTDTRVTDPVPGFSNTDGYLAGVFKAAVLVERGNRPGEAVAVFDVLSDAVVIG